MEFASILGDIDVCHKELCAGVDLRGRKRGIDACPPPDLGFDAVSTNDDIRADLHFFAAEVHRGDAFHIPVFYDQTCCPRLDLHLCSGNRCGIGKRTVEEFTFEHVPDLAS
jgi:hypothetical protein